MRDLITGYGGVKEMIASLSDEERKQPGGKAK
jgi:hypothetical protein